MQRETQINQLFTNLYRETNLQTNVIVIYKPVKRKKPAKKLNSYLQICKEKQKLISCLHTYKEKHKFISYLQTCKEKKNWKKN